MPSDRERINDTGNRKKIEKKKKLHFTFFQLF